MTRLDTQQQKIITSKLPYHKYTLPLQTSLTSKKNSNNNKNKKLKHGLQKNNSTRSCLVHQERPNHRTQRIYSRWSTQSYYKRISKNSRKRTPGWQTFQGSYPHRSINGRKHRRSARTSKSHQIQSTIHNQRRLPQISQRWRNTLQRPTPQPHGTRDAIRILWRGRLGHSRMLRHRRRRNNMPRIYDCCWRHSTYSSKTR